MVTKCSFRHNSSFNKNGSLVSSRARFFKSKNIFSLPDENFSLSRFKHALTFLDEKFSSQPRFKYALTFLDEKFQFLPYSWTRVSSSYSPAPSSSTLSSSFCSNALPCQFCLVPNVLNSFAVVSICANFYLILLNEEGAVKQEEEE